MGRRNLLWSAADTADNRKSQPERGLALRYIGNGAALLGVPARDLDAGHSYDNDLLISSGLYTPAIEIAETVEAAEIVETPEIEAAESE